MNKSVIITISVFSSMLMLISLFVVSTLKEHGDTNSATMYIIVYFIPMSLISLFNTMVFFISFKRYQKDQNYTFLFVITFSILSLLIAIDVILGLIGVIGFLASYFIWHIKMRDN